MTRGASRRAIGWLVCGVLAFVALAGCACGGVTARVLSPEGSARLEVCATEARTPEERVRGLSKRTSLPSDEGLVIEFPAEGQACITNEPVPFPIDTVFASADGTVVAVEHFAANEAPARCHDTTLDVLEVRAGVAASVAVGDHLTLQ